MKRLNIMEPGCSLESSTETGKREERVMATTLIMWVTQWEEIEAKKWHVLCDSAHRTYKTHRIRLITRKVNIALFGQVVVRQVTPWSRCSVRP